MNNIRIGIRLVAAFGFMGMLVIFMVLIGITKTSSLGDANSEIAGGCTQKPRPLLYWAFIHRT